MSNFPYKSNYGQSFVQASRAPNRLFTSHLRMAPHININKYKYSPNSN